MNIKKLSPLLSSQIAAGEVIDGPSSVVKELIENSLDSGSKKIDLEIEHGGIKAIILKDDGYGIKKKELILSLSRYTTSKIFEFEDFNKITSYGFRGEALSSIRSVSRIRLISRTIADTEIGWEIYSEPKRKIMVPSPILHPYGTTISVFDIFFNFLVRKKNLNTPNIEFLKIKNIVFHFVLCWFDVQFSIKHNGILVSKFDSSFNEEDNLLKIKQIFSHVVLENFFKLNFIFHKMQLSGWIYCSSNVLKNKNFHFFYINKKIISNNAIINCIQKASKKILGYNYSISYVLYLNIPVDQLDINIHPQKKKIRFYDQKSVYKFIYKSIYQFLEQILKNKTRNFIVNDFKKNENKLKENLFLTSYEKKNDCFFKFSSFNKIKNNNFGKLILILRNYYGVLENHQKIYLISFPMGKRLLISYFFENRIIDKFQLLSYSIPISIKINNHLFLLLNKYKNIFLYFGIDFLLEIISIKIYKIPLVLYSDDLKKFISTFLYYLDKKARSIKEISIWLSYQVNLKTEHWNYKKSINLLEEMKKFLPKTISFPPSDLLQQIHISHILKILKI